MKVLDIDLIVTNKKIMQKYKNLSPDSVDTLNSKIGKKLDEVMIYFLFLKTIIFKCLSLSQYSTCSHFKTKMGNQSREGYGLIIFCQIF